MQVVRVPTTLALSSKIAQPSAVIQEMERHQSSSLENRVKLSQTHPNSASIQQMYNLNSKAIQQTRRRRNKCQVRSCSSHHLPSSSLHPVLKISKAQNSTSVQSRLLVPSLYLTCRLSAGKSFHSRILSTQIDRDRLWKTSITFRVII